MILYEVSITADNNEERQHYVFTRNREERFALRALCYTRHWPCVRIPESRNNRDGAISVLEFERRENLL